MLGEKVGKEKIIVALGLSSRLERFYHTAPGGYAHSVLQYPSLMPVAPVRLSMVKRHLLITYQ